MAFELIGSGSTYPATNEVNVPVGEQIKLLFNRYVDEKTIKDNVVVFGPDFDRTSGPDNAVWINNRSGENPFYLRSPGFNGFVDFDVEIKKANNAKPYAILEDQNFPLTKPEGDNYCYAIITPKTQFAVDTTYYIFVLGQNTNFTNLEELPEGVRGYLQDRSLSEKTIYPAYLTGEAQEDNRVVVKGFYTGNINRVLNIKIISEGSGSEARYIWWFDDEAEPVVGNAATRYRFNRCTGRWRGLDLGLQIRFTGGDFELDEVFQVNLYEQALLPESYYWSFTTGDGSVYTAPEVASESPLEMGGIIPGVGEAGEDVAVDAFRVTSIEPYDGAVNLSLNTEKIIITFNKNINPATVTQDTVKLLSYPVSGTFDGPYGTRSNREYKIYKIIEVVDNKIILEL